MTFDDHNNHPKELKRPGQHKGGFFFLSKGGYIVL